MKGYERAGEPSCVVTITLSIPGWGRKRGGGGLDDGSRWGGGGYLSQPWSRLATRSTLYAVPRGGGGGYEPSTC